MIINTVYFNEFVEAFKKMDRDYFTLSGYSALYDYLEQLSDDIGEPIELDVIAIISDFTEATVKEYAADYGITLDPDDPEGAADVLYDLKNETVIIELDDQDYDEPGYETRIIYMSY